MGRRLGWIGGNRMKREEDNSHHVKEEYFIRNGALLLEKQISLFQGKDLGCEPCRIFSAKDIEMATRNYDRDLIIGQNLATVYRGDIDGRTVAVKAIATEYPLALLGIDYLVNFFLNQVAVKQVIYHKHIVKLHGCCLETKVPIFVVEFLPNYTLHDHLHRSPGIISWPDRVRIAVEVSQALAFMHYGTWKPIVHMDVKSSNVFFDENFTAKVSNFGFSVPIRPGDEYSQGMSLVGTVGYMDPEYRETLKVAPKCDVYSFGIMLVELLTGFDPFELGQKYLLSMIENRAFDDKVLNEAKDEEIQQFSKVAWKCLGKGVDRPTMSEVAMELRQIYRLIVS